MQWQQKIYGFTNMKYIFEAIFLGFIIVFADIQANMINDNKPINHYSWGAVFGLLMGIGWVFENYNWWFMGALILEHFVFFSPLLNFFRRPRKPFFYISSVGKTGSLWDSLLIKVIGFYPEIWGAGALGFIALQFKL